MDEYNNFIDICILFIFSVFSLFICLKRLEKLLQMLHLQQRSMLQDSNFLVRHLHRFILGLLLCLSVVLRDLVLHSRPTRLTHLSTPNQENLLYLSWK
jgi:hypothetical protein